jgi:hypothetical protein
MMRLIAAWIMGRRGLRQTLVVLRKPTRLPQPRESLQYHPRDVLPAVEIVLRMVAEAEQAVERANGLRHQARS